MEQVTPAGVGTCVVLAFGAMLSPCNTHRLRLSWEPWGKIMKRMNIRVTYLIHWASRRAHIASTCLGHDPSL